MTRCYWLNKAHAVTASRHPLVTAHLAYRRSRRIRRAVIITCVSVAAAGAAVVVPRTLIRDQWFRVPLPPLPDGADHG